MPDALDRSLGAAWQFRVFSGYSPLTTQFIAYELQSSQCLKIDPEHKQASCSLAHFTHPHIRIGNAQRAVKSRGTPTAGH
jgi:hypothetical protein